MGTIRKGILGGFSGKVGPVIGSSWRGKDVMRSLPKKSSREASEKQLAQRARFSLTARFLRPMGTLLSKYFGQLEQENPRYALAMSYHMKYAVAGAYPDFHLDFAKVIITKGELPGLQGCTITAQAGTVLDWEWTDNSGQSQAKDTDALLAVAYNAEKQQFHFVQTAKRGSASFNMPLPEHWAGDTVHCWGSFLSADGSLFANSSYISGVSL
jgi:hypothetical protein